MHENFGDALQQRPTQGIFLKSVGTCSLSLETDKGIFVLFFFKVWIQMYNQIYDLVITDTRKCTLHSLASHLIYLFG